MHPTLVSLVDELCFDCGRAQGWSELYARACSVHRLGPGYPHLLGYRESEYCFLN